MSSNGRFRATTRRARAKMVPDIGVDERDSKLAISHKFQEKTLLRA